MHIGPPLLIDDLRDEGAGAGAQRAYGSSPHGGGGGARARGGQGPAVRDAGGGGDGARCTEPDELGRCRALATVRGVSGRRSHRAGQPRGKAQPCASSSPAAPASSAPTSCRKLVQAGHQVRLIGRTPPAAVREGVEYVAGRPEGPRAVRRALEGVEAVYHLAGLVRFKHEGRAAMYELHVDCTRELLEGHVATRARSRASSRVDLRRHRASSRRSASAPRPTTTPSRPSAAGRTTCRRSTRRSWRWSSAASTGIPLVVLNPSLLMGPGDDRLSSTWTVVKFLQREIPAMPGGGMCFVDARDVADAAVNALTRGELYGRHLMGVNLSMKDFFNRPRAPHRRGARRCVTLPKAVNVLGRLRAGALAKLARRSSRRSTRRKWRSASTGSGSTRRRPRS